MKGPRSRLERSVVHTSGSMSNAFVRVYTPLPVCKFRAMKALTRKPVRISHPVHAVCRPYYYKLNTSSKKEPTRSPLFPLSLSPSLYVPKFYRFLSSHKTINSTRVSTARITNHLSSKKDKNKINGQCYLYRGKKCFYFLCLLHRRNFFSTWKPRLCGWYSLRRDYSTVDNRLFRGNNKKKKKKNIFYAWCFLTFWCNQYKISF